LARSPRKPEYLDRMQTPNTVGPGTYDGMPVSKELNQNVAPFNTMKERKTYEGSNEYPGPGTYGTQTEATRPDSRPSNVFYNKVPRFCPTAPGSTVFKAPSSVSNPGPGSYYSQKWDSSLSMERIQERYNAHRHSGFVVRPQVRAPSIPTKKVAGNAYSGLGVDTVGPACYDTNVQPLKGKPKVADFATSKLKRKVFEQDLTREN